MQAKEPEGVKKEKNKIERDFVELFETDQGKRVLAHLYALPGSPPGPDTSEAHIREWAGKVRVTQTIAALIERGGKV